MTTPDDIRQRIGFIDVYDEQISSLQRHRREHTGYLEQLATAYEKQFVTDNDALSCSKCFFVYTASNENGLYFSTGCSWCGPNAGLGVKIPWDKISQIQGVQVP